MTARLIKSALTTSVCSVLLLVMGGCDITLGPKAANNTIIVKPGTGIEILSQKTVKARVLAAAENGGEVQVFQQDIGGWIAFHPDHWDSVKRTIEKLRGQRNELRKQLKLPPIDD